LRRHGSSGRHHDQPCCSTVGTTAAVLKSEDVQLRAYGEGGGAWAAIAFNGEQPRLDAGETDAHGGVVARDGGTRLTAVRGIGSITTTAVVATTGDARLFESRSFATRLGLTTCQHWSSRGARIMRCSNGSTSSPA
jgi:transposase